MESSADKNCSITISESPDLFRKVIREWLVRFCTNFDRQLTPGLIALWEEQLHAIEVPHLVRAFQQALDTCTFFPKIADIKGVLAQANAVVETDETEQAWQSVLRKLERFSPDVDTVPAISASIDHAVRAAGGFLELFNMSTEDLQWAKKRFVEHLKNIKRLAEVEENFLPNGGDMRKILREAAAKMPALPEAPDPVAEKKRQQEALRTRR